ncbi:hypothetical protein PUNSTDRAFT_139948 [Punctularia strigosozonata HHB-11173 SS5]|uniref:uncharacterized protein n=1 Tax=Punctularia strigosozonata (strain HHB-11173) TaxID=741275 RepID=UPI0004417FBA|nr:uncharacterized protein PUNSTDRAFT_139948 [Punctularia strigosozonata HHB-11173 SS5]EIN13391.1 hypothetical protein PUNSTDRAFT_139948 [Punctularia strigosozonata HHB-11173 SS5]
MSSTRFRLFPWFKTDDTQKATTVAHRPSYGDYVLSRLPQELERYVFEMSCQDDVRHARMLSQVAQRVRIWVSPFVKEHVLLDAPDYDRSVRQLMRDVSKHPPPEFYVGSIMIPYNLKIPDAIVFLRSYRKLQSLACWIKKEHSGDMQNLWAALNEHAPEKLSIRLWGLFRQSDEVDWSAPLFQSVTHLEIVDSHRVWLDWRGLAVPDRSKGRGHGYFGEQSTHGSARDERVSHG